MYDYIPIYLSFCNTICNPNEKISKKIRTFIDLENFICINNHPSLNITYKNDGIIEIHNKNYSPFLLLGSYLVGIMKIEKKFYLLNSLSIDFTYKPIFTFYLYESKYILNQYFAKREYICEDLSIYHPNIEDIIISCKNLPLLGKYEPINNNILLYPDSFQIVRLS